MFLSLVPSKLVSTSPCQEANKNVGIVQILGNEIQKKTKMSFHRYHENKHLIMHQLGWLPFVSVKIWTETATEHEHQNNMVLYHYSNLQQTQLYHPQHLWPQLDFLTLTLTPSNSAYPVDTINLSLIGGRFIWGIIYLYLIIWEQFLAGSSEYPFSILWVLGYTHHFETCLHPITIHVI